MNQRQLSAIRDPALIALETARPKFGYVSALGSVVLTVNSGYE